MKTKPYEITKQEVFAAWKRVRRNKGAGGVDGVSIEIFENGLEKNLYKLWNRMSSGSYFPEAVKRVEIPKKDGSKRPLGIPTIYDRVAQEVIRARIEPRLEQSLFHEDSYGYRPGKSAIDAVRKCRDRNWTYQWVLEVDIEKFFDSIDHELLLRAVTKHCSEKWVILYVERCLKAPIQLQNGELQASDKGTPQGGPISPLLANLYLHYAFDGWMQKNFTSVRFERYADDIVCHCDAEETALALKSALTTRLAECKLKLHPEKTQLVFCESSKAKSDYPKKSFTFLGYTFKPRCAKNLKSGKLFTGFLPAVSIKANTHLYQKLKECNLKRMETLSISDVAATINPIIRGWGDYFGHFYGSALATAYLHIQRRITKWIKAKYRVPTRKAIGWIKRLRQREPEFFAHWVWRSNNNFNGRTRRAV